jgi:hypothetical protein
MGFHWQRYIVAAAVIAATGCVNPIGPFRPHPSLVVQVRDLSGAPVPNAWVYVELPNRIGSFYKQGSPTRADGTVTFYDLPAGRRPVEVKPPAGYSAVDEVQRDVDIVEDETVTTQFALRRI